MDLWKDVVDLHKNAAPHWREVEGMSLNVLEMGMDHQKLAKLGICLQMDMDLNRQVFAVSVYLHQDPDTHL